MEGWVVEGVRFTLFNTERKERVVVEKTGDELTVSSKQRGGEKASEHEKTDEPKKPAKASEPRAEKPASEPAPKVAAAARKSARTQKPKAEGVGTALAWQPIVDAGYEGYSARSKGAELQVLRSSNGRWALYVFWGRGVMKHITCYPELDKAKVAAQALHDKGLPPRPEAKLNQETIDSACPMPEAPKRPGGRKAKTPAAETAPPKTEDPVPPAPAPPPAETPEPITKLTPEVRDELRGSLKDAIKTAFSEME
jgi:hypothetical protein